MKKLIALLSFICLPQTALANPACVVCTVAIGASLEIARKLGISDDVVGLWAGALLAVIGYWTILWFDKKNWHFKGRNFWLISLSVAMIGFVYMGQLSYNPQVFLFLYIDSFLLAAVVGALTYVYSQKFYQWMKQKNNGHAHFPFEKVVLPLTFLFAISGIITYYPFQ